MQILDYYQLNEHPFRIGPDSRFLYFSGQVKEAIAKCEYLAGERVGPIYMYGPIGSGKTSILRRLYERLRQDERYEMAYLISPNVRSANAFLRIIMESFAVKTERAYDQSLKNLEVFLEQKEEEGKVPLLLVDEAQNLNREILKLIHYLLNFETATVKRLQIVLVGQEELARKVMRYQELASRMFPISIIPMAATELKEMIRFRWMVAGGQEEALPFAQDDDDVYQVLFSYSKGLPRDAVKVCDEVLRSLLVQGKKTASAEEVESIARELNLHE